MQSYAGLYFRDFLPYLTKHLSSVTLPKSTFPTLPKFKLNPQGEENADIITTPWFWPRFSDFLQPGDSILADTGTSLFGLQDCVWPSDVT